MITFKAVWFKIVLTGKKFLKFNWAEGKKYPSAEVSSQTANLLNAESAFDSNIYFCRNKIFNKSFLNSISSFFRDWKLVGSWKSGYFVPIFSVSVKMSLKRWHVSVLQSQKE